MNNPSQLFSLLNCSSVIDLKKCQGSFSDIARDPYIEEGFKYKEIARFSVDGDEISRLPHRPLYQSAELIPKYKGIQRVYPEFDTQDFMKKEVRSLLKIFYQATKKKKREIFFQAQRITTSKDTRSLTVPEGWHQDGTDIMGLICINRENITGGKSQVSLTPNGEEIFFDFTLNLGDMLIFDDRKFYHYATPILPLDEDRTGYRDIFIISDLGEIT